MTTADAGLRIEGLVKQFGAHRALDSVDLVLRPGEVRGLIGENGAGKSTLIKCLAGVHRPDGGTMTVDGVEIEPHLRQSQIAFVHQDLGLVDELSVGENIALTLGFPKAGPLIAWRAVWGRARDAYRTMGLDAPSPRTLVGRLSPAEKALLGIVRALAKDARVAVLDEPTASLPAPDVTYLLDALRRLKDSGTPILYVTHRLQELFEIADTVTVLRGGKVVSDGPMRDQTMDVLVGQMLGRALEPSVREQLPEVSTGQPVLQVQDLEVHGRRVSFDVRPGEVLGIVGLRGAGQERVGRALAGVTRPAGGRVLLDGAPLPVRSAVAQRMQQGIALLPADRQRESTLPGMSLVENLLPGRRNRDGRAAWISPRADRDLTEQVIEQFDVRPPRPLLPIDQLSGGNQQKLVVARVLRAARRLAVLEEPTAGVDVGSKFEIHRIVRETASTAVGVIVVSSDFEEIVQLCTRVLIVIDGEIRHEATGDDISEDRLTVLSSSASEPVGASTRGSSIDRKGMS